jgi:O-antigen/teichoic acid export membrane protein
MMRLKAVAFDGVGRAAGLLRFRPFDTSTAEGRRHERHRRVILSAIAGVAARVVSAATGLISVPLTLHYLGSERYGMWVTISSFFVMFAFADLGIGHGMLNVVADFNGKEDRSGIRTAVSSGAFILSIIGAVVLLAFVAAYPFVSWFEIFNVKSEAARLEAGPALAAAVICFALDIPLGVVAQVQMGLQQSYAASLWRCFASVLGLVGVLVVIWLKGNLLWLVFAFRGGPLLASVLNSILFFKALDPDLAPEWQYVSRPMMARIAGIGSLFFGIQIAMAVAFTSDNIIIAQRLGAESVTLYAVPEKMFSVIGVVINMLLFPLWPAYGEAIARGDRAWVRVTLIRSFWAAILTAAMLSSVFVIFGESIIKLWVGSTVKPPLMLLIGLGLWRVMDAGGNAVSMLLNGANAVRFELIVGLLMAAIAVALKLVFVSYIGVSGVIWATIIASLVTLPLIFWFVRRWLNERQ